PAESSTDPIDAHGHARTTPEAALAAGELFRGQFDGPVGARGPIPRSPDEWGTHTGAASGRPFFPADAGGPIRELSTEGVRVTPKAVQTVEQHLARFGPDAANAAMLARLRAVHAGDIHAEPTDLNFYTHELREYVRYRQLGQRTGQPSDPD